VKCPVLPKPQCSYSSFTDLWWITYWTPNMKKIRPTIQELTRGTHIHINRHVIEPLFCIQGYWKHVKPSKSRVWLFHDHNIFFHLHKEAKPTETTVTITTSYGALKISGYTPMRDWMNRRAECHSTGGHHVVEKSSDWKVSFETRWSSRKVMKKNFATEHLGQGVVEELMEALLATTWQWEDVINQVFATARLEKI
jgi:hypothetical protein